MSHKENLSPLASIASNENVIGDTKGTAVLKESDNVTKQQNVSLKQTTHISVKSNEKTKVVKKSFADANTTTTTTPSPPSTPKSNTTKKSIVYQDTIEQPRKSMSPMEKPILLVNEGYHVKIHHKKVKALTLPLKNKDHEEEVTRLKQKLDKLQEKKDERETTKKEIKQDIKKANEDIKSSEKISLEIQSIRVEKEEQNAILAELLEMMSEFSQDFKSHLLEHQEKMASKEQQIQDLLNTLSELNYQLEESHDSLLLSSPQ